MKRRILSALSALLLLTILILPVQAAQGSLSASASAASVTVGQSVTVTVTYNGNGAPIASIDAQLRYNAAAFQYVSCDSGFFTANGNAGVVKLSGYATGTAPTKADAKITFKAIAAGAGNFAVTTGEFVNDNDYSSLGTPGATIAVSATNPTLSGNANLESLKPSSGTLTPAFKAATTAYTITVPYTTTTLSLSAIAAESGAKVSVSGSNSLKVGKNTQTVTVTAPNGTTKKYTVTITRAADQGGTTTATTNTPEEKPLEVEVDGKLLQVVDTQPDATLPSGFQWESMELNGVMVSAAKNKDNGLTLLYLRGDTAETNNFYIYQNNNFILFNPVTTASALYTLLPVPEGFTLPHGAAAAEIEMGDKAVNGFTFEDTALADIALIYAVGPTGYTGLYVYDTTDGSLQRYREWTAATPVETEPEETPVNPFWAFINQYRLYILIVGAVFLVAIITVVVVLLVRRHQRMSRRLH